MSVSFFDASDFSCVTPEMKTAYDRDGFIVLENMITAKDCETLMNRMSEIVEAFDPNEHRTIFSGSDQSHARDDYFMSSGGEIRFFFEEGAFDKNGNLQVQKDVALNKVGHALHDRDEVFDAFSRNPLLKELVKGIGPGNPLILQSMYIFKPPNIGGEVHCHQDASYLWTIPQTVMGLWFALEDATLDNGCLQAIPGLHKETMPRSLFRRTDADSHKTEVITFNDEPWPDDKKIPLEVKQGSVIAFHGQLPHLSGPNLSDKSRHAYTLHIIDGKAEYPAFNWLQRKNTDPLRGF